jgi:uncharacterized protein
MNREDVAKLLAGHQAELKRMGVKSLALFGSVVRGEARPDSDVDFVVEFEGKATFDGYLRIKQFLETLLNRRVDLVTQRAIKPRIRPGIEKEAVYVA